jgi:tetratricopeptide (TPR) repeat protein
MANKSKSVKKNSKSTGTANFLRNYPVLALLAPALIFFVVSMIIYGNSVNYPLDKLDENDIITNNTAYLNNSSNFFDVLGKDALFNKTGKTFYRPVQNLSIFIDSQISDGKPWMFRISSIIFHTICCFLLFYLLKMSGCGTTLNYLLSSLFCVHPLFSMNVIWVPARGDILLALFILLSFIFLLKSIENTEGKGIKFIILHFISYFFAVFTKEPAFLFPLLIVFYFLIRLNEIKTKKWMFAVPVVDGLMVGLYYLIKNIVITNPAPGNTGLKALMTNLAFIPEALAKIFLPFYLNPMPKFSTIYTLIGVLFLLGILVLVFIKMKEPNVKYLIFGLLWFLVFALPSMAFRHSMADYGYDYLEHRIYLPAIGIFLFFAYLLLKYKNNKTSNIIIATVILIFAGTSIACSFRFENAETFYNSVIEKNPKCVMAIFNKAKYYTALNDVDRAMEEYRIVLEINPKNAEAYQNIGFLYYMKKDMPKALENYNKSIELKPDYDNAYYNRGIAWMVISDAAQDSLKGSLYIKAENDFSKSISLNPVDYLSYYYRGLARFSQRIHKPAIEDLTKSILLNPEIPDAYLKRGLAWMDISEQGKGCEDLNKAYNMGKTEASKFIEVYCKGK